LNELKTCKFRVSASTGIFRLGIQTGMLKEKALIFLMPIIYQHADVRSDQEVSVTWLCVIWGSHNCVEASGLPG